MSVASQRRLIPAHAGKTGRTPIWECCGRAHPRSRGENADSIRSISPVGGSSPLTRGKRWPRGWPAGRTRLIPAHAGKTSSQAASGSRPMAHPRSRGENSATPTVKGEFKGSSPLTRGKRTDRKFRSVHSGLIPAHAGKTDKCLNGIQSGSAHPRSRGENSVSFGAAMFTGGSSPLTRGKPRLVGADLPHGRLIPAHAGKTW